MKVKTLILRAAGTNCDRETEYAFHLVGCETELVHVNELIRRQHVLDDCHILVVPGGFTYGDDIAAGKILANELEHKLQEPIRRFIGEGKLILGICNGFQVLVKAGLLPGESDGAASQSVTLTFNDSGKFEDRWVHLKVVDDDTCIFTRGLAGSLYIPVAHAEGKFVPRSDDVREALWKNNQVVLQYVDPHGALGGYPWNPNGSVDNIAGICDPTGRIFGLMPHPERHIDPTNHPRWTRGLRAEEGEGLAIFRNAAEFVRHNL